MFLTNNNEFIIREFSIADMQVLLNIAARMELKSQQDSMYKMFYAFQKNSNDFDLNKSVEQFLKKADMEKNQNPRNTHRLAVCDKNNQVIGNVTVDMIPSLNEQGQLVYGDMGYFIDPEKGSQGIVTKAVSHILSIYFKTHNRMDITAHPDNMYSKKLIERLNGQKIGYQSVSHYQNEPRDVFVICKADFEKYQNKNQKTRICSYKNKTNNLDNVRTNS